MRIDGTGSARVMSCWSAAFRRALLLLVFALSCAQAAVALPLRYSSYVEGSTFIAAGTDGSIVTAAPVPGIFLWTSVRVTKLAPGTQAVLWSTTIAGGSRSEQPTGVAMADDGSLWITGLTDSTDFPLINPLPGAAAAENGAFIIHLSADGSTVLLSSVLGVSADRSHVAIGPDGTLYWAGVVYGGGVPTTANVIQPNGAGAADGFVVRLTPAGVFGATYLGGSAPEASMALAIGVDGDVYVAGTTDSSDLPATAGAFQPTPGTRTCFIGMCSDGFIARLSGDLASIRYLTYLHEVGGPSGGAYFDRINAIAVNRAGDAFVTGSTNSGALFPVTPNAAQPTCRVCGWGSPPFSKGDAFVARLNAAGSALVYSTFLSGGTARSVVFPAEQYGVAIAVDASDNAWVAGTTTVSDFPLVGAYQSVSRGYMDAFVAELSGNGQRLTFSTLLGGTDPLGSYLPENATDLALTEAGGPAVWVAGATHAPDFPTTGNAYSPGPPNGATDPGFVSAFMRSAPIVWIDVPTSIVGPSFTVGGWAIDRGSVFDSGIDAIHIYAYPNPGSGAAPIFLGTGGLNYARSDIGAIFGPQFANAGWTVDVGPLPAGPYLLAVFAHSALTGTFSALETRNVTVMVTSEPILFIDVPGANATSASPLFIGGWAIDRGAPSGTGVDTLHVWAYPNPGSGTAPIFLGVATYGITRRDVGAVFGSRFTASGYELRPAMTPGTYLLAVFAHSTVTNSFAVVQTRTVTIQ